MADTINKVSLRKAALIAGVTILFIALVAPFAELFIYPKLVNPENAAQTVRNIISSKTLLITAIFSYLLTFTGDIIIAWALYILLAPVNKYLSLLTALFRLFFAMVALVALLNLVMFCFKTFRSNYHFGIIFFSVHLILLGYLVIKSGYIPKLMGIVLVICGLGYLTDALKPFLFPNLNSGFITITFFGELVFMLWLLIKGFKIEDTYNAI